MSHNFIEGFIDQISVFFNLLIMQKLKGGGLSLCTEE